MIRRLDLRGLSVTCSSPSRSLVTGGSTEQLVGHLRRAKQNGLREEQRKEAIIHLAFDAGWPKAMSAIQVAKRIRRGCGLIRARAVAPNANARPSAWPATFGTEPAPPPAAAGSRRGGRPSHHGSAKSSSRRSSRTKKTRVPIVVRQYRSNSSCGMRLRLPTLTARISPALILREIVGRDTPKASATCSGVNIRPHRWAADNLELGDWLLQLRARLTKGAQIDMAAEKVPGLSFIAGAASAPPRVTKPRAASLTPSILVRTNAPHKPGRALLGVPVDLIPRVGFRPRVAEDIAGQLVAL